MVSDDFSQKQSNWYCKCWPISDSRSPLFYEDCPHRYFMWTSSFASISRTVVKKCVVLSGKNSGTALFSYLVKEKNGFIFD